MSDPIIEATQPAPRAEPGRTWTATDQWAIVEVFGHRRLVGIIQEVEQFGAKMLRIDGVDPYTGETLPTQFYSGGSIFSLTLTTKEAIDQEIARYKRPALAYRGEPNLRPEDRFDGGDDGDADRETA